MTYTDAQTAELEQNRTDIERATVIAWYRQRPDNVADALDRILRIDTVKAWLTDVRRSIVDDYLAGQADQIEATTGAAFRAPVDGLGLVYRTHPKAKLSVADPEAFARWYCLLHDEDPDRDPASLTATFADGRIARTLHAETTSDALVRFVNGVADEDGQASGGPLSASTLRAEEQIAALAREFVDRAVHVRYDWAVDGDLATGVCDIVGDRALYRETGEIVPGVRVVPPVASTLTIRGDKDHKALLDADLTNIVGPPTLD